MRARTTTNPRWSVALLLIATALVSRADGRRLVMPRGSLPDLVVWAWERPEDLRELPQGIGVAFLAQTLALDGERVTVARRRQPLRLSPAAPLVAVTRIEHRRADDASRFPSAHDAAALIAETGRLPRVQAIQIDFDATRSERAFYRELLMNLRPMLDPSTPVSITALASWCVGDRWLDDLPIDEAVPMLFRMGPFNEPFRALATSRRAAGRCGGALGVSLDEPITVARRGRRVYVFNPSAWRPTQLLELQKDLP